MEKKMRWFKHFSDNYRGRSVDALFEKMGHTGVACYFLFLEICTEKMEKRPEKNLEKSDIVLNFPVGFVRRNLRISQGRLEVFLRFSQGLGLFSYKITEKELQVEVPILFDLLHFDVVKSRSRREQFKIGTCLDKDKDKDKDKELKNIKKDFSENFLSGSEKPNTDPAPIFFEKEKNNDDKKYLQENISQIVLYLNKKTGKNFSTKTKKTVVTIKARLLEKFTLQNFFDVIDFKTEQWQGDEKMCEYLRPETLFSNKFESYLNAISGVENAKSAPVLTKPKWVEEMEKRGELPL